MATHDLGPVEDFPAGSHSVVQVGRLNVGVFNVDGRLYALPNICPHQFGPLCEGPLAGVWSSSAENDWRYAFARQGEIIVCPWHGIEFDITTGKCLSSSKWKIRQYAVRVDGDRVVIDL